MALRTSFFAESIMFSFLRQILLKFTSANGIRSIASRLFRVTFIWRLLVNMRVTNNSPAGGNELFLRFLNSDDAPFKKAKELRKEILGDILPIISPERKLSREEVQSLLERLVEKINSLNLRPEWRAERFRPGDPEPVWGRTAKIQGYRW